MKSTALAFMIALAACGTQTPQEDCELTVFVRSPSPLDGLKVYYDTTGGHVPSTPAPVANELATDQVSAEWSSALAVDLLDVSTPAQQFTYATRSCARFVAIIGIASGTLVNGGTLPHISYLDGPDRDPVSQSIASATLDLEPL